MSTQTTDIRLVGEVLNGTSEDLRQALLHSYSTFGVYRRIFSDLRISREDILNGDPMAVLRRLPLLEGDAFHDLAEESLVVGDQIVDVETSSGTTGRRKKRFISYGDDVSDHGFLVELFRVCGIGASDRVACLDTDPANLMVSLTKAFDLLGVEEAYTFCVGSDFGRALEPLPKLDPSVIVSIPSILERCFEPLRKLYAGIGVRRLRKVVYVGEPPSQTTRSALGSALGVEVFGYYGASETSALGIECPAHDCIHLFTNRNVIEIATVDPKGVTGEIVVTTLTQRTLPLLRYALKDVIAVIPGSCPCGLKYPRIEVKGRVGDGFSLLGSKVNYEPIRSAIYGGGDSPGYMQLIVTREGQDKLTIVLPESVRPRQKEVTESLQESQPDLDFLVESGYLKLEFRFVEEGYFLASRKLKRIVDRRGGGEAAGPSH